MDFFGSQIVAPVQLRFGGIDELRAYVDRVAEVSKVPRVRVRHRKGGTRAHYEIDDHGCAIAVPTDEPWAMRESVVLHEIAHHICVSNSGNTNHDRSFTTTMLALVEMQLGAEGALLLRTGYLAGGVPV